MSGPGNLTPAPTPPPPSAPAPPPRTHVPHPMSRPATEDAPMDDEEEGSAPSSRSSDADDDLLRDDDDDDSMLLERNDNSTARAETPPRSRPALVPTPSASHLPSPPGATRRSTASGCGAASSRSARLSRAAAAFVESSHFERGRDKLAGGRGPATGSAAAAGADEARTAQESAWNKLLDKNYDGMITYDPFLYQLEEQARSTSQGSVGAAAASIGRTDSGSMAEGPAPTVPAVASSAT